jgi:nicotinate-nucleotide--dimethylbenzimidazole phosphoribosyltransferase
MTDLFAIPPLDRPLEPALRGALGGKAKPPGSLGRIEDLAVQLGLIQQTLNPRADRARLLLFAGDHGLTRSGVSSYPASVTAAMVATILAGKASANAFAQVAGADVLVIDAGVDADLPPNPRLIDAKIAKGTNDAAVEPAMTPEQAMSALRRGAQIARQAADDGFDILALGEMGIGNSASAALLLHRLGPLPLEHAVGLGAGHSPESLSRKRAAVERAARRTAASDPLDVLAQFGGFEIAMMTGAILGAARTRAVVAIDGFIATSAALVAARLAPASLDHCVFAHRSAETGHAAMLDALSAAPLFELSMRLGEGSGAVLAVPLLRAAAALLNDVASLEDVLAGRL